MEFASRLPMNHSFRKINMATSNMRILSIDVEYVATSYTREDRSPCSVAVIDDKCLRIKDLEEAPSLEEALQKLHSLFDSIIIIVAQRPKHDIKWLKLEKGVHYSVIIDLIFLFSFNFSSLVHEAWTLLNIDLNAKSGHLAIEDAKATMQLYMKYKDNKNGKQDARHRLLNTRPRMTPAKACNYNYEGAWLAGFFKQTCTRN
ncbi:unnamed protein product [Rotaria sp. Silwood2]|nr:unnamed protein product [Rotaria sp. Silwood2]CAF2753056.1 unnamed protein product [Rotaria sp. Silwood2]CAF3125166.1 unnamed protein product [Rotaria sp. Silwood2]CAF4020481.1 unnamed protein product [Rotaria sp. Silwood2]CAF4054140.1 unnamed protein product [Rotaria sp. Silwood2]